MFADGRAAACSILLAAMVLTGGCGGAQSRFASHMQRGESYFSRGDFTKASVEFRNAMQIQPTNAIARLKAGQAEEKLGKIREAAGLYQSVIDALPDNVQARADLGRLLVFGGAAERAVSIVEPGLAKHPDEPQLLIVRGAARARLNNAAGARQDAERAVQLAPTNEAAVGLLAGLERQAGENEQAIALVRDALQRIPAAVDSREVLVSLYMSAGQPEKAEEQWRRIIELRPQQLRARYQLAALLVKSHRLDEAQHVLEEAVKTAPQSAQPKLVLVDFLAAQRSPAAGEKTLRDFIAQQPDNYALRIALGELQLRSGAVPQAAATFAEVVKRDVTGPSGITARDRIAAIQVMQGQYDAAQKLLDVVLKSNPGDNEALLLRAKIALERQQPAAAITDLRAVLRDQPNAIAVRRMIAAAFVDNGQPGLAEEQLRAALEAAAGDTGTRIDLAQLLGSTGRAAAAVKLLEDGVRAAPSDASLRAALVRAELASGDLTAARKALADLDTLTPGSVAVPLLAGQIGQAAGQLAESVRDYEQALKLQPLSIEPLAALTKVDVALDERANAVTRVRATIAADPHNPLRQNLLAETLIAAKAYPEAIETLTTLIKTTPAWGLPYHNLAVARLLSGDPSGAMGAYEAGLRAVAFEPNLTYELAGLYERQGRVDDAIARCEALYAHSPAQLRAASNLALLLVDHRTDRQSLDRARDLTAAFAVADDPALLDAYGWVRYKRGETDQALAPLERAAQGAPHSAATLYHLAMVQLKAGAAAKARANLEAALATGANFRGIADARLALASFAPARAGG
jgi:predicted Zn-dependent protease